MKKLEQNKKNNKGFSLVELIVVIAIMIVLVAVLAPVFTKYVEQSRRATDVQNANTIASAILVDVADGSVKVKSGELTEVTETESLKSVPKVKGKVSESNDAKFYYGYSATDNTVKVYVGNDTTKDWSGDLTDDAYAANYKNNTDKVSTTKLTVK